MPRFISRGRQRRWTTFKESRMKFDNATNLDRKSGGPSRESNGNRALSPTYAGANVGHPSAGRLGLLALP
jgi:hypothetical protein